MNTIDEVKRIEASAKELENSFDTKVAEMTKQTDKKILEMKGNIESNLQEYQNEQNHLKETKLNQLKEQLQKETAEEIDALKKNYVTKKEQLVDIVIEEVMKRYGNS